VDGKRFASKREASWYTKLKALQKAGAISDLRLQVKYDLRVNDIHVCSYVADYVYVDKTTGETVVADAKGVITKEYRLKRALMWACLGIDILEL
jgi:hypothetical protein